MDFIKEKALDIFSKLNDCDLDKNTSKIECTKLEGLSNEIYKVEILVKDDENIKIKEVFFKIFGKISCKFF